MSDAGGWVMSGSATKPSVAACVPVAAKYTADREVHLSDQVSGRRSVS
jgi:hypothetical protein